MKKYLLITAISLVFVSGCSKSVPDEEVPELVVPEEVIVDKIDESKPFIYVEIPENAKDYNDYKQIVEGSPQQNVYSQGYPYLAEKDINGGTERIVLNFKSSDAQALQTVLDGSTQKSLKVTDEQSPGDFTGKWAGFQVADLAESDGFISFTTIEFDFAGGDATSYYITSYVFDKEDGSLVPQEDVIKRSGYSPTEFESAFIKAVEVYNESIPEEESYRQLIYKPEYFVEDFDSSTLPKELLNNSALYAHIKPEQGIIVNKDGSLNVTYEYMYLYGLYPEKISYGFVTIPAP